MARQLPHFRRAVIPAHVLRGFELPAQQRHRHAATMSPRYLHQRPDWPTLTWDERALATRLGRARHLQERLLDRTQSLDFEVQQQVTLEPITSDVVKSSAIEGEVLNRRAVRSSAARQVGMSDDGISSGDRHIKGRVLVTLDSTRYCEQAFTRERFLGWTPPSSPRAAAASTP